MSDTPSAIANHIKRAVTGPMWHGPALDELLDGVTYEHAFARPIAGAHTIWELVLHVIAWADIARERLAHRSLGTQPPEVDWPPVPVPTAEAWAQTRARLTESHRALASEARALSADDLAAMVPVEGQRYPVLTLLHGVIEHGTYHGGQIALLKRALSG